MPIDLTAAMGAPADMGGAPVGPADMFADPLAGLSAAPGEEPDPEALEGEAINEDPALAMCEELFPDWSPDMHQKLLDLIDARLAGEKLGDFEEDEEPDADQDEE